MSDKDLFKQYHKIYKAYMKLAFAAEMAYKKLVQIQHASDATKELRWLIEAVEAPDPEPPKEGPEADETPKPKSTKTKDGSDS